MAWRVFSVSTADWQSKVEVTPTSAPWARAMGSGKSGTMTFSVGDPKVAKHVNETTMAPWKRLLVIESFGLIIYAGFITGADYDQGSGVVTVSHADLWTLLRKRIMADIVSDGVQARPPLTYTGVSRTNIVKQAIYQGQNDAARFNLPIVLPTDAAGPVTKTFDAWALPTVASVIEEAMNGEFGPEVDLFPRWRDDGSVEWFLRMGNLTEGEWSWDLSVPKAKASGLQIRKDGADMANRVVAVGEGSEMKMLLSVADGSATSDFLPLDAITSYKDEKDQSDLAAKARADLATNSKPTEQISMDVEMDDEFLVSMLRLGGTVNWHVKNDPFIGTGWRSSRLIEFSGNLTNKIHLEFQTI